MSVIEDYYDQTTDDEWNRLGERHRTEFAVSFRAMQEYLPEPPAAVLDLGGGPGRYAIALAGRGHHVTLADLSSANLASAREKAKEAGVELAAYDQVNALDLGRYASESFDAALVMGPLYHLIHEGDRVQALREVQRVLKPGGIALIAFITRISPFRDSAQGYPDWVVDNWEKALRILETGILDGMGGFTEAYLAHPNEVEPLVKSGSFELVAVVGCEGVVAGHEKLINGLSGDAWERWVDLNYRIGKDPTSHGASDHLLVVGRRAG